MNGKKSINKISTKTARGGRLAMKKLNVFHKLKRVYKQSLYIVSALVLAVSVLVQMPFSAFATPTFSSYPMSSGYKDPKQIRTANGSLWYIEVPTSGSDPTHIGSMTATGVTTDYNIPALTGATGFLGSLTVGTDGNIWFVIGGYGSPPRVGVLNVTTGATTLYPSSSSLDTYNGPGQIVAGSDGNLYFYVKSANTQARIAYLNPSIGTAQVAYTLGATANLNDMTIGPDGKLWYTDQDPYQKKIGRCSLVGGSCSAYTLPSTYTYPYSIVSGPDGNLWVTASYTSGGAPVILKVTTSGTFSVYTPPTGMGMWLPITGPDGLGWLIVYESGTSKIGHMTSGGITTYTIPGTVTGVNYFNIVSGPGNALWFSYKDSGVWKMGKLDITPSNQTVSFTSTAPTNAVISGATYTPTASATSGLPVAVTVDSSSASVCTIVSGVVSFQGAGTCTLNANQGGDFDYSPAPQVQQAFTVYPVEADSSVAVSCPSTAHIGDPITCTITIDNAGPAAAENASLTALFSNSFSGTSLSGGGTLSGQSITWSATSIASGASTTTLTFSATASVASKASFSAALLQTNPDPDISNNIAQATIVIS